MPANSVKYLGMHLDEHLNWDPHTPTFEKVKQSQWNSNKA